MSRVARITHNTRNGILRQRGRADLKHFCVYQAAHIALEHGVPVLIVHLDPAAARTRPGKLLGYSPQGYAGTITDHLGQAGGTGAVVNDAGVNFIDR